MKYNYKTDYNFEMKKVVYIIYDDDNNIQCMKKTEEQAQKQIARYKAIDNFVNGFITKNELIKLIKNN